MPDAGSVVFDLGTIRKSPCAFECSFGPSDIGTSAASARDASSPTVKSRSWSGPDFPIAPHAQVGLQQYWHCVGVVPHSQQYFSQ
jgi:hypothetical protein